MCIRDRALAPEKALLPILSVFLKYLVVIAPYADILSSRHAIFTRLKDKSEEYLRRMDVAVVMVLLLVTGVNN